MWSKHFVNDKLIVIKHIFNIEIDIMDKNIIIIRAAIL